MKKSTIVFLLISILLAVAAIVLKNFDFYFYGNEAIAAADQVKTGGEYLQARAEMAFWRSVYNFTIGLLWGGSVGILVAMIITKACVHLDFRGQEGNTGPK